jgi:hypothetical protein
MCARVALTLLYAVTLGVVMALDNLGDLPGVVPLAAWALAPLVGFLVGRWWVVLAVLGGLIGRPIGWDSSENDGNPALWLPYVMTFVVFVGFPLLLGVRISVARDLRRHRRAAEAQDTSY